MAAPDKVKANPTKAFFVRTITKDISLADCILDLIDNSVDGAWKLLGGEPITLSSAHDLAKFRIDIIISADQFGIRDNCGGISFDDAVEYAFTFGRKDNEPTEKYSIGVYGIGMKRAVFKIGNRILVHSSHKSGKTFKSFSVPIDVEKWLKSGDDRNWDFDLDPAKDLPAPGVEITIKQLNEGASALFSSPAFLQSLKRVIGRDYALHIHRGLTIRVNGEKVAGWRIEVRQGGEFRPMRVAYQESLPGGKVNIEIVAGMSRPPPDTSEPEDNEDDEDRSGWYVICNGRIVLAANKTEISGWGTENWPKWHPQYAGFLGFVVFSAESASILPLTTTKRNVEVTALVYRRALAKMRDASRGWIDYTNHRKPTLNEAKRLEAETKSLSIYDITPQASLALPKFGTRKSVRVANIHYQMPLEKVRNLAREFGSINMAYREVGIKSFEYAYTDHVEEK